jgi:DNA polymerase IV (archaeal DinB-like DNA polymerase)
MRTYYFTRSKTTSIWTADLCDKRTAIQLLSEFLGRQKLRLVGVGVSQLGERNQRQILITDFLIYLRFMHSEGK